MLRGGERGSRGGEACRQGFDADFRNGAGVGLVEGYGQAFQHAVNAVGICGKI